MGWRGGWIRNGGAMALLLAVGLGLGCGDESTSAGGGGAGAAGGPPTSTTSTTSSVGGQAGAGGSTSTGSGGSGGSCGDQVLMAAFPQCVSSTTAEACEAAGGMWTTIGLSDIPGCVCPTGQSGCPCTRATQCLSWCRAETSGGPLECDGVTVGECAGSSPFAGCWCRFDDDGTVTGYCID